MKHNWEYKKLGEVCEMKSGSIISADELAEGYLYPCFGGNGIRGYIEKYSHDGNFCIIGRVGALCGNVHQFDGKFYATEHAIVAKPIHIQNVRWLYYELSSLNLRKLAKGAAQPVLSVGTLNAIKIPVPPMEVQEQIVAELDKINELIEQNRELLRNLDSLAQSLFYDTFGDPITNPKGWPMQQLKNVCSDITDGDHSAPPKSKDGIPFITISNIDKDNNRIDFTDSFFVPELYFDALKDNRKPKIGDVLYTVTGSYGITVLINSDKPFCFQRHIGLLRPIKSLVNSTFIAYWGRTESIKAYADNVATGIAQKTVSLNSLRVFPIIVPPIKLQNQFAAKVEAIEAQKATVEKSIAELQTLLDSRMDYWFN